ncbi:MAG: NAD-dependent epimerase/dehydratase family protein [Sediminibacterium sp.]
MSKRVIITGSTGMIGGLVLNLCLECNDISEVVALVRRAGNINHPKYKEVVVTDFLDYTNHQQYFKEIEIIFYCLGAYTGTVPAEEFRVINYDYPLSLAKAIHEKSPNATFCLLSGQGADRTEKSTMQFARDKGAIENALSSLHFKAFYSFRPGYIYPTKKRKEPNFFYTLSRFLYPILKLMGNNLSITDNQLANAMFTVGINGYSKEVLENKDMRLLQL